MLPMLLLLFGGAAGLKVDRAAMLPAVSAPWDAADLPECRTAAEGSHGDWNEGLGPGMMWWEPLRCRLPSTSSNSMRLKGKKILVFGDSQATHLANAMAEHLGWNPQGQELPAPYCGHGPQKDNVVPSPDAPHGYQAFFDLHGDRDVRFGCVRCSGCVNMKFQGPEPSGLLQDIVVEHLAQKLITTPKSSNISAWLFNEYLESHPFDYVMGNVGLHELGRMEDRLDAAKENGYPSPLIFKEFRDAVATFADTVAAWQRRTGGRFTYILTTDINPNFDTEFSKLTNTYHIDLINEICRQEMNRVGVDVFDAFALSRYKGHLKELHTDRCHMHKYGDKYYNEAAGVLLGSLNPPSVPESDPLSEMTTTRPSLGVDPAKWPFL